MPNYCDFDIHVVGYKDNVDELIRIMQNDSTDYKHFCRIFDCDVIDPKVYGVVKSVHLIGDCAWSTYLCLFPGLATYFSNLKENPNQFYEGNEWAKFVTNIVDECRRLNLSIDIHSFEPGMEFLEHYVLHNGNILIDHTDDYKDIYIDEYNTYDEMKEDYCISDDNKMPISREEFNDAKATRNDSIESYTYSFPNIVAFPPKHLCNKVMYEVVKKDDSE